MEEHIENRKWDLDRLYKGFSDEAFLRDYDGLKAAAEALGTAAGQEGSSASVNSLIDCLEQFQLLWDRLSCYAYLRVQQDTADGEAASWNGRIDGIGAAAAEAKAGVRKAIADAMGDVPLWETDQRLRKYRFLLEKIQREQAHMLSVREEGLTAELNLSGARAWSRLFDALTSTASAVVDGKRHSLWEVRNMAYQEDGALRRRAYEAELESYGDIELPLSFALCGIKRQANVMAARRGYPSVLDMNLARSNMRRESLEPLLAAIKSHLPIFWRYLRAKAKLLGKADGLPWYDLFAPVGRMDAVFSPEEARRYLTDAFRPFSSDMSDMIERAFQERWIDFYPREGKAGGAFCQDVSWLGQCRILTNFNGTFDAVVTLAHELGHGYHGMQIRDNLPLNREYSMQLAETASTFNEIFLLDRAVKQAGSREEKLFLLENLLMGNTQVICDIYSRFLFEREVVERCPHEELRPEELKAIMLSAQKKAYGDGLDSRFLHPYMWACKVHYYIDTEDFYNFPYAFGALFSLGLYQMYCREGEAFVPRYNALLRNTPMMSTEDAAASVGVDITTSAFWSGSLEFLESYVKEYEQLAEETVLR